MKIIEKSNKKASTIILFLLVLTIIPFKFNLEFAAPPPSSGDWIIDTDITIQNQIIKMNGSVVITSTGSLTLENSEIIFMGKDLGASNGEANITIQSKGAFIMYNSKITTDSPDYLSYLMSEINASIHLEDSLFSNLGYDSNHASLNVFSNGAYIENCTINVPDSAVAGIYLSGASNTQIINCQIISNSDTSYRGTGIEIANSEFVTVINCLIEINGDAGNGINFYESNNCTIQQNTIISYAKGILPVIIAISGNCRFINVKNNTLVGYSDNIIGIDMHLIGSVGDTTGISIIGNNITLPISLEKAIYFYIFLSFNKFAETTIYDNYIYIPKGTGISGPALEEFDISYNTITAKEIGIGIMPISNSNITVSYNIIEVSEGEGILLQPAVTSPESNIVLSHNTISKTENAAIYVEHTANIEITSNTISNLNSGQAIHLESVENVTITANSITELPDVGINITTGNNIQIINNIISQVNETSTEAHGMMVSDCNNTVISGNTISYLGGTGIICDASGGTSYGYNLTILENTIVHSKDYGIQIQGYFNVQMNNNSMNTIRLYGIYAKNVTDISIEHIVAFKLDSGIYAVNVNNCSISHCNIEEAYNRGIFVVNFENDLTIKQNTIENSNTGIYLFTSTTSYGVIIENNYIAHCSDTALYVGQNTEEGYIRYNFLYDNYKCCYVYAKDTTFYNNTVLKNYYAVIFQFSASNNLFYYNDFIDNFIEVSDFSSLHTNKFSEYIPTPETYLGNYWNKYAGVDEVEPFGIGDTPYNIGDGLQDLYPLMHGSAKIPKTSLSHPPDLLILENTTGYTITWLISSIFTELNYIINFNGTVVDAGTTNGTAIVFDIPKLTPGNYTVTVTLTDPVGQNVTDIVLIQVLPSESKEGAETAGNFFQQLDWTSVGVGAGAGVLVAIIGAIAVNALHKPKSKKKPATKRKSSKKKK